MPHLPPVSWPLVVDLVPAAITIALLAGIESLLSALVADRMIGGSHRTSAELLAQGAANIASPLFGGLPATGAIAAPRPMSTPADAPLSRAWFTRC